MPLGVLGVVVVGGEGVSVGRDKPGFVGGSVEVTKTDLVGAGVSSETLMQEVRLIVVSRSNIHRVGIQIFFIARFYLGIIKKHRPEGLL